MDWIDLELILNNMRMRINFGAKADIVPLIEIEGVAKQRARQGISFSFPPKDSDKPEGWLTNPSDQGPVECRLSDGTSHRRCRRNIFGHFSGMLFNH